MSEDSQALAASFIADYGPTDPARLLQSQCRLAELVSQYAAELSQSELFQQA